MAENFAVKIRDNAHIYIHNTLENAAWYLKEKIEARIRANDRDGIGLEIMACLIMIAFSFEAKINFLGFKAFGDQWGEGRPYLHKVKRVSRKLGVQIDCDARPYLTVRDLKRFRDTVAHGKPAEIRGEKDVTITREELERRNILKADWEKSLNEEFLRRAYDDTEELWKDLFDASGLKIIDTITGGESTIEIIESVDVPAGGAA
jgi:hypothetical protein